MIFESVPVFQGNLPHSAFICERKLEKKMLYTKKNLQVQMYFWWSYRSNSTVILATVGKYFDIPMQVQTECLIELLSSPVEII